jgi:hypothetical protein
VHHGVSGHLLRFATDYQTQGRTSHFVIIDLHDPSRVLSARVFFFVDPISVISASSLIEGSDHIKVLSTPNEDGLPVLHGLYYFVEFQFRGSLHVHTFISL